METQSKKEFKKCSVSKAKQVVRALDHKLRNRIIQVLLDDGPTNVTDLFVKMRLEQSVASQHLAVLLKANLIESNRQGKFIYYSVSSDYHRIMTILDMI